jgi:hypothetical protein
MSKTHLATLPSTNVYETGLNLPDPVGKGAVQCKVGDDSEGGEFFCGFEAIFVVESKGDGGDYDGSVSKTELDIGVPVRLAELEAVQVVLQGIVGGVLAVWGRRSVVVRLVSGRERDIYQKHYKAIF